MSITPASQCAAYSGQYLSLKENPNQPFVPKTYLFGAKAASGYFLAKQIIQLICSIADLIDRDSAVRDKLKVVYVEDYRVTLAELLCPAARYQRANFLSRHRGVRHRKYEADA